MTTRPDDVSGKCGTEETVVLTGPSTALFVTRRHIDLMRTASAI